MRCEATKHRSRLERAERLGVAAGALATRQPLQQVAAGLEVARSTLHGWRAPLAADDMPAAVMAGLSTPAGEGVAVSMDGRGRALDNIFVERLWRTVKYEDICLRGYDGLSELRLGLTECFAIYNGERPHQSLGNRTPDPAYTSGEGGGASIVDCFCGAAESSPAVSGAVGEGLAPRLPA